MARTKRPSMPEDQLSPQELKKRRDNTEAQRRRRLKIQEKSKQASNIEQQVRNDGGPTGQQAVTPNSDFEVIYNGDSTRLHSATLRWDSPRWFSILPYARLQPVQW